MNLRSSNNVNSHKAFFLVFIAFLMIALAQTVRGDAAGFDLFGPRIEMTVTRGSKTLPISSVPNLQPGDRLWIHPDFPDNQSVHYLMIVAFLQGSTNPPPESWFIRLDTWTQKAREEGTVVTVPAGAEQALLFLAPETGGDFSTLRSAVRGRPGVFVRASRDLVQASMARTRIDKYLDEIRDASSSDSAALHQRATLLAQTLHIKVNQDCFDKPVDEQPSCLTANMDQLLFDDGHGQTAVAALVSGPSADLAGAISSTPAMGGGYYSAYVGAIVDTSALAILDPLKNFGPSAFGSVQFRAVSAEGEKGDWQPLVHLVRTPSLKEVRCPDDPNQQCTLSGSNLFLLDSIASDPQFKNMVPVPLGYVASTLNVPRPVGTLLYIKLRDDPATVDTVALPVLPSEP
jgi:hypothetical protein